MDTDFKTLDEAVDLLLAYADTHNDFHGPGFHTEDGRFLSVSAQDRPIVKIECREGTLTRADVDALREALAARGRPERESWIGWQGVSWLSGGTPVGVSIRIDAAPVTP